MAIHLTNENVWFDQYKFMDAERDYYTKLAQRLLCGDAAPVAAVQRAQSPLIEQISQASPSKKEDAPTDKAVCAAPAKALSAAPAKAVTTSLALAETLPTSKEVVVKAEAPTVAKETKAVTKPIPVPQNSPLFDQISMARQQIHQSLAAPPKTGAGDGGAALTDLTNRMQKLELENAELKQVTNDLKNMVTKLSSRVELLEKKSAAPAAAAPVKAPAAPAPVKAAPPARPAKKEEEEEEDDDDFDMFASDDEEDAEAEKIKQERLAAYAAKKSKKPAVIAKSSILLDVKPWDDETDMKEMEKCVRTIEMDGLLWGQALLKPIGYGIHKLTINCVVEDDKVSVEELSEKIEEFEDFVQSVDVAAFNKI